MINLTDTQVTTMHQKIQVSDNELEKSTCQTSSRERKYLVKDNDFFMYRQVKHNFCITKHISNV